MENKMTHTKALEYVIAKGGLPDDVTEHLEAIKKSIENRNSRKSDKPTKTQKENMGIADKICEQMVGGKGYTITQIIKEFDGMSDYTNQKITAIMTKLDKEDRVTREDIKGKANYFIVI